MRSLVVAAALLVSGTAALGATERPAGWTTCVPTHASSPRSKLHSERESYRPGQRARLVVTDRSRSLTVQILEAGPELDTTSSDTEMNGVPVTPVKSVHRRPGRQPLSVPVGRWRSGLYFARLEAPDGRVGFAPFVVAPRRLGVQRVAVVLPTLTWQAYNFRDDDGDGRPDSWYAGKRLDHRSARSGFPRSRRAVRLRASTSASCTGSHGPDKRVDFLSQSDLERVSSGRRLRRAYDLIVFAGHHEYVTTREYDVVERYRDRGGNLMFLSANNYFWRVIRHGDVIQKSERWRDLDRPESSLIGVQYIAYQRDAPTTVGGAKDAGTAVAAGGTGLRTGLTVRPRRRRDRPRHEGVAPSDPGARRDPERLRAWQDGSDDVLRDGCGQRGCSPPAPSTSRGHHDRLRRLAAAREPLGHG